MVSRNSNAKYRADQVRRLAELAPRLREVVARHANELGQSRIEHGICCGEAWRQFATWVGGIADDDPRLRLLAGFPGMDWTALLDNYFIYTVGGDSFGDTVASEWCYQTRQEPLVESHERLFDLLLLDAVATAFVYPWDS